MFEKIIEKLRAIPTLGVARTLNYVANGVVERSYAPICVLVDYGGINQVFAFNKDTWKDAIQRGIDRQMIDNHPNKELGRVVQREYINNFKNRPPVHQAVYAVQVAYDKCEYVLILLPSDTKRAVEYGLKVSKQHKFHANWFMRLIRKIGLAILDR